MRMRNSRSGFTVAELIVCILIVVVMTALLVPGCGRHRHVVIAAGTEFPPEEPWYVRWYPSTHWGSSHPVQRNSTTIINQTKNVTIRKTTINKAAPRTSLWRSNYRPSSGGSRSGGSRSSGFRSSSRRR